MPEETAEVCAAGGRNVCGRWIVFKGLNADPALIRCFVQRRDDIRIFDFAHTRTVEVGVVGVEMDRPVFTITNNLTDWPIFRGHCFDIEMEFAGRTVDQLTQPDRFLSRSQKIGFGRTEGLERDRDA